VQIPPSWSWPKPVHPGGPPVLIGGAAGPKLFAHIAEYADGWIPIGGAGVKAALVELRRACDAVGRDPATLRIGRSARCPTRASSSTTRRLASLRSSCDCRRGRRPCAPILDEYASPVHARRFRARARGACALTPVDVRLVTCAERYVPDPARRCPRSLTDAGYTVDVRVARSEVDWSGARHGHPLALTTSTISRNLAGRA
jgi:hypothetical protein